MTMQELIANVVENLQAVSDRLDEVNSAEEKALAIELQTKELKAQHDKVKADLQKDTLGLNMAQQRNQQDYAKKIMEAQREHHDLTLKIEQKSSDLAEITALLNSARSQHDQIQSSLESLRKQIIG